MTGDFKITLPYLRELGACREGQREFQRVFPDGGGYQEVLDRCAEEGRLDFGGWLLSHLGPTGEERVFGEDFDAPNRIILFAGSLRFDRGVRAKYIWAGGGITAGEGIKAGWGIKAGEDITAGGGYCIFAGLRIKKALWPEYAIVSAAHKPENLQSGHWAPKEAVPL